MCHGEIPESGLNKLKEIKTRGGHLQTGEAVIAPRFKGRERELGKKLAGCRLERS